MTNNDSFVLFHQFGRLGIQRAIYFTGTDGRYVLSEHDNRQQALQALLSEVTRHIESHNTELRSLYRQRDMTVRAIQNIGMSA